MFEIIFFNFFCLEISSNEPFIPAAILQIIFPNMGKSKIETENQNGLS
jgi:hypothetical protein